MPHPEAVAFVAALAARRPIAAPVLLLVAHPDDETLWASLALTQARRLTLAHATDGAPADGADAQRAGFASVAAYARRRRRELRAALAALGVAPRLLGPFAGDGRAAAAADRIARRLFEPARRAALVVTHRREGGHADHDACAAIGAALGRPVVTFAAYGPGFVRPGEARCGFRLSASELARKRRALARFASQRSVIAAMTPSLEHYAPC